MINNRFFLEEIINNKSSNEVGLLCIGKGEEGRERERERKRRRQILGRFFAYSPRKIARETIIIAPPEYILSLIMFFGVIDDHQRVRGEDFIVPRFEFRNFDRVHTCLISYV